MQLNAHKFEAWSVFSSPLLGESSLYSGSDDCTLKVWDTRIGANSVDICREYECGVTTFEHLDQGSTPYLLVGQSHRAVLSVS